MAIFKKQERARERDSSLTAGRAARWLFLVGLLLVLAGGMLTTWQIWQAGQSLLSRQSEAEALLAEGPMNVDPEATGALVVGLREDVVALERASAPFLWAAPAFGWLPRVGPLAEAAPHLMEMADAGTAAAVLAFDGLEPALTVIQQGEGQDGTVAELVAVIDAAQPQLARATLEMERVAAARAAIRTEVDAPEQLPWRVRQLLDQYDQRSYLVESMAVLPLLPQIMGSETPRTYLLLAQNEDEIRPTGGFLSGAGLMTVAEGNILDMQFLDASLVDAWVVDGTWSLSKPYDPAPAALQQLMGLELHLFRDANFWPDFPHSAEQAIALYRYGQDAPPLDGVIAFDQQFLSMLLQITGPVTVPDLAQPISARNLTASLEAAWGPSGEEEAGAWVWSRKDFLGPLADAVRMRLFGNLSGLDPLFTAEVMHRALAEKHLQIYVRDPAVAAILDRLDWDGRLETSPEQDLLLVVDTNVGYNKVNRVVESHLDYTVSLEESGEATADLTVVYEHTGKGPDTCRHGTEYRGLTAYEQLIQDCYWNYLRLYTPPGSELLQASEHPVPAEAFTFAEGWEGGAVVVDDEPTELSVFGNFLIVPPEATVESHYRYALPGVVQDDDEMQRYTLRVVRQPGVTPRELVVRVALPEGAQLVEATPAPEAVEEGMVIFRTTLRTDTLFNVTYRER